MSSCIGILQEYTVGDDWEDYTDRLKQYFVPNKMDTDEDAETWRAVLLTVCGAPAYSLIKDLLAPAKLPGKPHPRPTLSKPSRCYRLGSGVTERKLPKPRWSQMNNFGPDGLAISQARTVLGQW